MFVSTASGLKDTPVTWGIIVFSVVLPLSASLSRTQYYFDLGISPQLTEWHQWWRIPLNSLVYLNQSQVVLSVLLHYNLRVIERLFGSRKFLSYITVIFFYSMLLTPLTLFIIKLLPFVSSKTFAPSQNIPLFAVLVLFQQLVPVVYRFSFTPITAPNEVKVMLSDKVFVYLVAFQLAFSNWASTLLTALLGWTVGGLVYSDVLPGKSWRIPLKVYRLLKIESPDGDASVRTVR